MQRTRRLVVKTAGICFCPIVVVIIGNIRTKDIKGASFQLVSVYPERFNADFENNKQVVKELNLTDKKIVRNKVAGYITRIMSRKTR